MYGASGREGEDRTRALKTALFTQGLHHGKPCRGQLATGLSVIDGGDGPALRPKLACELGPTNGVEQQYKGVMFHGGSITPNV